MNSRIAAALAGTLAFVVVGAVGLYVGSGGSGNAAAQQLPSGGRPAAPQALVTPPSQSLAACVCASPTTLTVSGTSLIHCQCGAATCVVGEYVTGQAKSYSLECVK